MQSLLRRMEHEAGVQPNSKRSFVAKEQATSQGTQTETKINPETTVEKDPKVIPTKGGENKKRQVIEQTNLPCRLQQGELTQIRTQFAIWKRMKKPRPLPSKISLRTSCP